MPELSADEMWVTARQAAELLGVSLRTVERMQSDGDLVPVYLPTPRRMKLRRFRRSDIDALVELTAQATA
jgi:excisionase family DNA binding protein